jgi:hypothetical protein
VSLPALPARKTLRIINVLDMTKGKQAVEEYFVHKDQSALVDKLIIPHKDLRVELIEIPSIVSV